MVPYPLVAVFAAKVVYHLSEEESKTQHHFIYYAHQTYTYCFDTFGCLSIRY